MKIKFQSYFLPALLGSLSTVSALPKNLPENAKARGLLKRFDLDDHGNLSMDLFEGGPSISCNMKSVKGNANANPKTCMDGDTVVTTVDSECGDNLPWGQQKKCLAASIVNGATGDTYYIDADGEVVERNQMDYPEEEDPPNENEPMDEYSEEPTPFFDRRQRSLLRGNANSMGINFGDIEGQLKNQRNLQGSTPVIDVMVVYSQYAKSANGGTTTAMQNRVNLAIAESNQAYANSGIDLILNLVHLHEDTSGFTVDQDNPSSMSPALSALRSSTDGQIDYVHQMRIDVGADMVALITAGAGCGIAYLCGNSPTALPAASCTFSVTRWDCATGYYSFSHELGHNMGVTHDKGTTNTCTSSDYRYGFRDPNANYRSILAYSCATGQCDNMPKSGCTRQQFFSTPVQADWLYNGQRQGWAPGEAGWGAGVGETNNAKKINDVAAHIAGFYDSSTLAPVTSSPSKSPTKFPTKSPSTSPTKNPTPSPTVSSHPTVSASPTKAPTPSPTKNPTLSPSKSPTKSPVSTVPKFICSKNNPGDVCATGEVVVSGGECETQGQGCGNTNRGDQCWLADCPSTSGPTPPTPTASPPTPSPPTPNPPTGSCLTGGVLCSAGTCCNGCETSGKMADRVCL
jgi:hypothetical protein